MALQYCQWWVCVWWVMDYDLPIVAGITGQLGSSPQWNSRRGEGRRRALLHNIGCSLLVVHDQGYNAKMFSHSLSSPRKEIAKGPAGSATRSHSLVLSSPWQSRFLKEYCPFARRSRFVGVGVGVGLEDIGQLRCE